MTSVNAYLNFDGNCKEAFKFYKSIFGGEFTYVGTFDEMPQEDGRALSEDMKGLIMHISLPIGPHTILMGSDTGGEWASRFVPGNNVSLSINTDSKAEADTLFAGLSAGGTVTMPLCDTFWGAYFGMFTDKFGIHWMVNYDDPAKMQG